MLLILNIISHELACFNFAWNSKALSNLFDLSVMSRESNSEFRISRFCAAIAESTLKTQGEGGKYLSQRNQYSRGNSHVELSTLKGIHRPQPPAISTFLLPNYPSLASERPLEEILNSHTLFELT